MKHAVAALMTLSLAVATPSAATEPAGRLAPAARDRSALGLWRASPGGSLSRESPPATAADSVFGTVGRPSARRETGPRERLKVKVRPFLRLRGVGVRVAVSF